MTQTLDFPHGYLSSTGMGTHSRMQSLTLDDYSFKFINMLFNQLVHIYQICSPSHNCQPTTAGMLKYHISDGGACNSAEKAVTEVAEQIEAKWNHDTVVCKLLSTIVRKVEEVRKTFVAGKLRYARGKLANNETLVKNYKTSFEKKEASFVQ